MKLATYSDGSRDGQLVVVSRDLSTAHFATGIASRLHQLLDDWQFLSPQLEDLSTTLNQGKARHAFAFDPRQCMAPLPRSGRWVQVLAGRAAQPAGQAEDAAATAAAPAAPPAWQTCPGAGDDLLGPHDTVWLADGDPALQAVPQWVMATGELAQGSLPAQGLESVRLLMLATDWQLPSRDTGRVSVATTFNPVAVTPDELGSAWHGGLLQGPLTLRCNEQRPQTWPAPPGHGLHAGQMLALLARHRRLRAGSLVGCGPLAVAQGAPAAPAGTELAQGRSLVLQPGDRLRLEMLGTDGLSVFGALDLTVQAAAKGEA